MTITRSMANAILEGTGKTIDELKAQIETTMKPASADLAGTKVTVTTTAKIALVRSHQRHRLDRRLRPDPQGRILRRRRPLRPQRHGREDYIWNGADDNGSGSVGVMNIAKAMAANPVKPKRTIVFGLWTGEEEGLLGSRYYALNPTFPMDKTVGYLNYDMISRPYDADDDRPDHDRATTWPEPKSWSRRSGRPGSPRSA